MDWTQLKNLNGKSTKLFKRIGLDRSIREQIFDALGEADFYNINYRLSYQGKLSPPDVFVNPSEKYKKIREVLTEINES